MESKLTPGAQEYILAVTDFIFVEHEPRRSDVIFIPGASHPEHALRAAELYHQGMADYLLPSGRYSVKLGHFKGVPEAFRQDYPDEYETEWAYLRTVLKGKPKKPVKVLPAQQYEQRDYSGVQAEIESELDREMEEYMKSQRDTG
jgi:hypothetical protein